MTATSPELVVELAPGFGPLVDLTDGQWVRVAASAVVDTRFHHGRGTEFETFTAGTCTVTFEDSTRVFDPLNASGTYFGDLNPGMQIRVRGLIGVTYYPRWRGFVESIVTVNARTTTFVTLTCSDAFKVLNQTRLPLNVYGEEILSDTPHLYWRLGEADGETAVDASGNDRDGTWGNFGLTRGSGSLVSYSNDGSVQIESASANAVEAPLSYGYTTLPFSVEFWLRCATGANATTGTVFTQTDTSDGNNEILIYHIVSSGTSHLVVTIPGGTPNLYDWSLPYLINDGLPHHIVVTVDGSGTQVLYLDGTAVTSPSTSSTGVETFRDGMYLGAAPLSESVAWPAWIGEIDDFAIYETALSSTQVADHYSASKSPWDGDFTGARIGRILDLVGWPAGLRAIDTGEMVLGPADLAGMSALAYLQLVAQSEQGRLFVDKSGLVTFHDAARFQRETVETTSQYTFSDDEAGDAVYSGGNFSRDDTLVYNQASIQRKYGTPQTAEDATSVAAYGPRTYTLSGLLHRSDALAHVQAAAVVYRYKDPQSRVRQLTVQPDVDSADWADIFALEIGHRVTVEQTPADEGTQIALAQVVEHVSEQVNGDTWMITFTLVPVDPHEDSYLVWGGDGATQGWGVGTWR
jgi:hypothetical protein